MVGLVFKRAASLQASPAESQGHCIQKGGAESAGRGVWTWRNQVPFVHRSEALIYWALPACLALCWPLKSQVNKASLCLRFSQHSMRSVAPDFSLASSFSKVWELP